MRKIFGIIVAASALFASCSSPYYPEYVPVVSLGASTSNLICESEEGSCSLNVISNVEYTATIISGSEWLSFKHVAGTTYSGSGYPCHRQLRIGAGAPEAGGLLGHLSGGL